MATHGYPMTQHCPSSPATVAHCGRLIVGHSGSAACSDGRLVALVRSYQPVGAMACVRAARRARRLLLSAAARLGCRVRRLGRRRPRRAVDALGPVSRRPAARCGRLGRRRWRRRRRRPNTVGRQQQGHRLGAADRQSRECRGDLRLGLAPHCCVVCRAQSCDLGDIARPLGHGGGHCVGRRPRD